MVVHLQKRSLKDVKRKNRQTVVNSLIENNGLSRVEIAQKTELAPSTVSTLVTELIGDGILIEAGSIGTAGRSRTVLTVNPEFATARTIFRFLQFPSFLKIDSFAKGRVELVELKLTENSVLNGKSLDKLTTELHLRVLVCVHLDALAILEVEHFERVVVDDHRVG